VFSKM